MIRVNINDPDFTLDDMPTNWGAGVCRYKGELLEGILYDFFSNTNQLASESEYKEGIANGKQIEYWPNGQIKSEMFEKYDNIYGSFKQWNDQGVLITHQEHDNFGNLIKKII